MVTAWYNQLASNIGLRFKGILELELQFRYRQ
jgi:hypothetical protein